MDTNLKHTLQSIVDKCKLIFQPVTTNGYAELNEYGYVKTSQLPGFVDDIIEGYYNSIDGKFYTTESYTSEIIPEGGKIYVSLDSNKTYRWSSSSYVVISETIALGETSSTAFAGDKGKANSEAITTLQTSILNKLDKTMNLSDVQNRQIAADNLLNASSNAEKFVYVNSNGNVDFAEKPAAQIQSDWTQSDNTKLDYIKNKPTLATVATSGSYADLTNTPTIPSDGVDIVSPTASSSYTLASDKYYSLGTLGENTTITFTLPSAEKTGIYSGQFTMGELLGTVTFPVGVTFKTIPAYAANKTYQFSIVNNLGVIVEF